MRPEIQQLITEKCGITRTDHIEGAASFRVFLGTEHEVTEYEVVTKKLGIKP